MRKILLLLVAVLFMNAAYAEPVPARLMRSVRAPRHHLMKASLRQGVLKLITTHAIVDVDSYEDIIAGGACSVLLADPEKGWGTARIDRIEVFSRDERQGYAFVDARNSCMELGKIMDAGQKQQYFKKRTWICTMNICDDPNQAEKKK